ncbi:MAG: TRAP transporter small permease [Chloroflexi bacterium]|nr:TRAP transporter small permease [Chloroflexota bacterium]MYA51048.1 TRAP transporter small permease [Chloroflexota bacterium]MYF64997.1 TRAP transporter small permease [Chloroflexota bacterium]MYK34041.1 TRAP transporter small permease [Chloroflexota bacterium]
MAAKRYSLAKIVLAVVLVLDIGRTLVFFVQEEKFPPFFFVQVFLWAVILLFFIGALDKLLDIAEQQREARAGNPLLTRIFDGVIDISAFAGALIVLYVAFAIGANVLMRALPWTEPLKWALPTTEFSLLYLTFLAAPIVLRREGHVRMTAITERLGGTARLWFYIVGSFISSGVCGVLTYKAFEKTVEEFQSNAILLQGIEVPRAEVTWVIPYGFTLLGLQFLRMGVNAVRLRRYRETVEEAGI